VLTLPTVSLERDLLDLALECARGAAAVLQRRETAEIDTKSSPTDLVTDVDRAAEALIVSQLLAARPDDGVLGEEGASRPGTSGVTWVIDPLDGTTNFVYGIPAFSVSIGAQVDGATIAGVVCDPSRDETFAVMRGGGATCNGEPIHVRNTKLLGSALIGTGFSYDAANRRSQALVLDTVLPAVRDIRRNGSAALDLCWVGAGRLDGHYEAGLSPWDHAAGALVASEAGAWVGTVGAAMVAIVPQLADEFTALLRAAGQR
jgi:myo-inositol-1(or 4)-monophosphatase